MQQGYELLTTQPADKIQETLDALPLFGLPNAATALQAYAAYYSAINSLGQTILTPPNFQIFQITPLTGGVTYIAPQTPSETGD